MASITLPETPAEIIGSYELDNGATVSIKAGHAGDYADMRAAQLKALTYAANSPGFGDWCGEIKSNVRWLITSIAAEIVDLLPIVSADAERSLIERQAKAAIIAAEPKSNPLSRERVEALTEFWNQLIKEQDAETQPV